MGVECDALAGTRNAIARVISYVSGPAGERNGSYGRKQEWGPKQDDEEPRCNYRSAVTTGRQIRSVRTSHWPRAADSWAGTSQEGDEM